MKLKGYVFAALAAVAYGTNPAFAIPLYADGMSANSVLLFRYALSLPLLILLIRLRGHSFRLAKEQIASVAILGILMAFSSLTLFESYNYMNSGVASTLLFVYPIMVALLMIFFFHERFRISIALCLAIMCAGLALLIRTGSGFQISPYGCLLVMISAITYAIYIVMVNVSAHIRGIPTSKLLFYVLCWGSIVFMVIIPLGNPLSVPTKAIGWINLAALAIIPTILSLSCTTAAIQSIGSTPTAIFGALEPVTAIVLSVIVLNQNITSREIAGGLLIVVATTMVIADTRINRILLHVRKLFPRHRS